MSELSRKVMFARTVSENHASSEKSDRNLHRVKSMQAGSSKPLIRSTRNRTIGGIDEMLQCAICSGKLKNPRMLPCQHTFCFVCLETQAVTRSLLFKEQQQQVKELFCPICKKKIHLKSLEDLPGNMYLDSLLRLVKESPPSPTLMTITAEERCAKCQTVSHLQDDVCQHCLQYFCKICWIEHLKEMEDKLPDLIKQLEEFEQRLEHKMENYGSRCENLKEKIQAAAKIKIEHIHMLQAKALEKLEQIKEENHAALDDLMGQLESMKRKIKGAKMKSLDSETNKISSIIELRDQTSNVLDEILRWGETPIIFDPQEFTLEENKEGVCDIEDAEENIAGPLTLQNPTENIDTMTAHYKTRHFSAKLVWKKCPRPSGVGISPWHGNNLYLATTDGRSVLILNQKNMKLEGKLAAAEMICPVGVAFSHSRREIYVVDKWKHCVHVFSDGGDYLKMLCSKGSGSGKLQSPEDIDLDENEQLIICDTGNDRIIILDPESGKQISTIGLTNNGQTELNMPTSVTTRGNQIIIADSNNHSVKIYNEKGKRLQEIGSLGRNRGQFRSPEIVAVDSMGFLFVGDSGNARIQIFDPEGTLVRVFGNAKNDEEGFKWISGITITSQLEIVVTDNKNRSLKIF